MKNVILKLIPEFTKQALKDIIYTGQDVFDALSGRRDELLPPCKLRVTVGLFRDARFFRSAGELSLHQFKQLCALKPDETVLDLGCGCGQVAVPLTSYLEKDARYEGFDILAASIEWCRKHISPEHPNFHFQRADIFNKYYNPQGKYRASEYRFPYEDETFDFVFAKSVFTHMLPEEVENYLAEITRVLKRGGRCLITYFLLNKNSLRCVESRAKRLPVEYVFEGYRRKLNAPDFKYDFGRYRTTNRDVPEEVVCYDEHYIHRLYEQFGLDVRETVYGFWCGEGRYSNYQDMIIAGK